MKSVYIIRHGQSAANAGGVSKPDKTIELTTLGLTQAQNLLKRWRSLSDTQGLPIPTYIYHSQMRRAKQTAIPFIDYYQLSTNNVGEIEMLNEFGCLGFETVKGMVGTERRVLMQQFWQTADIDYRDAPDSDSFADFINRVDTFITTATQFEPNSLFFGHGMWIGLLAYRLLGCKIDDNAGIQRFRQFQTAMPMYNTVVYRLNISKDGVMQLQVVSELKG